MNSHQRRKQFRATKREFPIGQKVFHVIANQYFKISEHSKYWCDHVHMSNLDGSPSNRCTNIKNLKPIQV